jgi:hypothetical protein
MGGYLMAWYNREILKVLTFDIIIVLNIFVTGWVLYKAILQGHEEFFVLGAVLSIIIGFLAAAFALIGLDKRWRTEYG